MTTFEIIQSVTSAVTAAGVVVAAVQLYLAKREAQSEFEDSFNEQYRRIVVELPLPALIGRSLSDQELEASLRSFYNYFDLSNEQAFLVAQNRFHDKTWTNWREGITQHMERPAFEQAWTRLLPDLDGSFDDFRTLLPDTLRKPKKLNSTIR